MRRLLPWLLVPLAALAGFLAGQETAGVPSDPSPPSRSSDAAPQPSPADRPTVARREPPPRARTPSPPDAESVRALGAVLTGIPSPPPLDLPRTDAVITGTVTDEEGAPVPGVLLRAEPDLPREVFSPDESRDADPTPPLEQYLAQSMADTVEWTRRTLPLRRETRSDAAGAFVLDALVDLPYSVRALSQEWMVERVGDERDVLPGGSCSFQAFSLVPVPVDVVLVGGRTPERAWVYSDDDGDDPFEYCWIARRLDWTPSNRTIRVPRGRRSFRARSGGLVSSIVQADVGDGATVTLELGRVATLRVVPQWSADGPGPTLVLFKATRTDESPGTQAVEKACEEAGTPVEFPDLLVARWRVDATLTGGRVLATAETDLVAGTNTVELPIPHFTASDGFSVRVTGADGRPAQDVNLACDLGTAERLASGTWFVVVDRTAGAEAVRVEASCGDETVSRQVPADAAGEIGLRFPQRFDVEVDPPASAPGVSVVLQRLDGDDAAGYVASSCADEDGVIRFHGVAEGSYELRSEEAECSGAQRLRIAGNVHLRFAPSPFRAFRVEDVEEDGAAASWGLADGDLVVGIDGEEFRDALHMDAAAAAAAVRGEAVLDVLRGRRKLRVRADARQLRTGGAGLTLVQTSID